PPPPSHPCAGHRTLRPMKSLGNFPDPFIAEIAGQPEALRRAGNGAIEQTGTLEAAAAPAHQGRMVLSGMGSSYDACYPAVIALDTRAGEETGPSTMTFVCALAMLGALARTIAGATAHDAAAAIAQEADRSADAITALVADRALPDRLVAWHGGRATTVILGRGAARAAAEMGALTIKEAAGMPVESLQAAQFRHGPLELAGPDLAAIVLATEPETAELDRELAADLAKLGAAVLLVTTGGPAPGDTMSIAIGSLDRLVSSAAAVVPAQLLAWRISLTSGRTPGSYLHASD